MEVDKKLINRSCRARGKKYSNYFFLLHAYIIGSSHTIHVTNQDLAPPLGTNASG